MKTEYVGEQYAEMKKGTPANIIAIYEDEKSVDKSSVKNVIIVTERTPFYAEMGGQVGDKGFIENAGKTAKAKVLDTQKKNDTYLHIVEIVEGSFSKDEKVSSEFFLSQEFKCS